MNSRFKETFDKIQAGEELKEKTRIFLAQKTRGYTKTGNYQRLIVSAACLFFVLIGGHWLYFAPTAEISIDINPSIELGINRFDKVISVNSFNDDGKDLTSTLSIRFLDYTEAVNQILENENIAALLSNDAIMTIAVIGPDGAQSARMLSGIKTRTTGQRNTYCYSAHSEEVEAAHKMGLSYGKYRALLEIQALDLDTTPEKIKNMSMREIRDLIEMLSSDTENRAQGNGNTGPGHYGVGNGRGQRNGKRINETPSDNEQQSQPSQSTAK